MTIQQQFNQVAQEYDAGRKKFIPCFDDFYDTSTRMILSGNSAIKSVLDLGAGTGLLSYYWYKHLPDAEYLLTDIADKMLDVSRKRFAGVPNVNHLEADYSAGLPAGHFDAIISALSIHHMENEAKQRVFDRIYDKLPQNGGLFVNYDQFCAGSTQADHLFNNFWEGQLAVSGLTDHDIQLWKERRKLDRECTVEDEVWMLRRSGFSEVKCIYSYHKFSVVMAMR